MITHNLFPTILQPTREATVLRNGQYISTSTLIDNIFINTQQSYKSGLIYSGISDHYPVLISLATTNAIQENEPNTGTIKYRIIDESSIKLFKLEIKNTLLNIILQMTDAPAAFSEFYKRFNELYEKYFSN